ncbi:MAG: hypothetical protein WC620_07100, partial [Methanoregula sp.]
LHEQNQFQQRPKIYQKRTKTLSTKRTLIVARYSLLSGILRGLRLAYAENLLQSVEELIHGAIFQDFLEMAEYFLSQGDQYKHPAAFLIGGVLEEHLRKVAIKNEILTVKDNGQFRRAEDLNMDIRKKTFTVIMKENL